MSSSVFQDFPGINLKPQSFQGFFGTKIKSRIFRDFQGAYEPRVEVLNMKRNFMQQFVNHIARYSNLNITS